MMQGKVYSIMIAVNRPGGANNAIYKGDLIFTDHGPLLVLQWEGPRDAAIPTVTVPLDAAKVLLCGSNQPTDYYYPEPVDDPRPMQ